MENSNQSNPLCWSLSTLSEAFRSKEISPVEIVQQLFEYIDHENVRINAFISLLRKEAIDEAKKAEKDISKGEWKGPLHGIPIGLKDVFYTKDTRTTMGSEIYKDFVPDHNATAVNKMKQAGAIIMGKLNTHQFAYGPLGDRSYFGPTKNPFDNSKISGGSSSGSGAAVASSMCFGALGTDTGGSVRIPSSCCGIVGMKPTFGRISKYGVYPLNYTIDTVGPMTKNVKDNAMLLNVLSGYDKKDPYSVKTQNEDFTRFLHSDIKGIKIGIPSSYYYRHLDDEVSKAIDKSIQMFKQLGAKIYSVDIPSMDSIFTAHQTVSKAEAYTVHEKLLKQYPYQYEKEVKDRLLANANIKAHEYIRARQYRQKARQAFDEVLNKVNVLLTPTIPILPTELDQRKVTFNGETESIRSALLRLTAVTSFNGFPSISLPCGTSKSGLPIGCQLIGKPLEEARLYQWAYKFEQYNKNAN